uniref:USP domain-containing protein n=1 Tax=Anopheles melas TaxID=34690 RepID=A0A182TUW6_9DIPT
SACGAKIGIRRALLNRPDVVSIGVVWDSERPPADQVHAVLKAIGTTLRLCDVFQQVSDHRWAQTVHHELVGVVSYYGKHYTTFFFHTKLRVWVGTASSPDGLSMPDHLNQPRRRDSGNWSGDRNSASSSSSTTLDNPYLYLVGKRQVGGSVPASPTRANNSTSSTVGLGTHGAAQFYDAGYDSYSLSSTDSFPSKHQPSGGGAGPSAAGLLLSAAGAAVKIPDSVVLSGDCEKLCMEADQLLEKSRLLEDAHDLETALVLCHAAASKARAAMDAPYSNPHTMTFARMKHNTCVMRARSLNRRILIEKGGEMIKEQQLQQQLQQQQQQQQQLHLHHQTMQQQQQYHVLTSGGVLQHRRQNSKEKLLAAGGHHHAHHHALAGSTTAGTTAGAGTSASSTASASPSKSIEIYATLPKKKVTLKLIEAEHVEPEPAVDLKAAAGGSERESRSLFARVTSSDKDGKEGREKRSRSEDRNKALADPGLVNAKDTLRKHKEEKDANERKEKEAKSGKKQHKIRRKLLMGGLIRRKNRSMPDLTEAVGSGGPGCDPPGKGAELLEGKGGAGGAGGPAGGALHGASLDDSAVGLSVSAKDNANSGYLSEGHFDYHPISNTNPNLERSKLMRKSFHGSGRSLSVPKVPPPPPVRIGSALSAVSSGTAGASQQQHQQQHHQPNGAPYGSSSSASSSPSMLQMQKLPLNGVNLRHLEYVTEAAAAAHPPSGIKPFHEANVSNLSTMSSNTSMSEDSCQTIITTCAVVHQEQSPAKPQDLPPPPPTEEVDSIVRYQQQQQQQQQVPQQQQLELPPYPSPPSTTCHSRQASEDFPPPPPAIDFEPLHEQLSEIQSLQTTGGQGKPPMMMMMMSHSSGQTGIQNTTSILAQLQAKQLQQQLQQQQQQQQQYQQHQEQLNLNNPISTSEILNETTRSEIWLKELQLKQLALKQQQQCREVSPAQQQYQPQQQQQQQQGSKLPAGPPATGGDQRSVRDLASRFEQIKLSVGQQLQSQSAAHPPNVRTGMSGLLLADQQQKANARSTSPPPPPPQPAATDAPDTVPSADLSSGSGEDVVDCPRDIGMVYRMQLPKPRYDIAQSQIQEEIREVEMLNQVVQQTLNNGAAAAAAAAAASKSDVLPAAGRTKKKSVSFCDQVILVATADEDEDDGFIPNPILERVLRTAGGAGGGPTAAATAAAVGGCTDADVTPGVLLPAGNGGESVAPAAGLPERLPTLSTSITYHPIKAPSPTQQLKQQQPTPSGGPVYSLAADMHKQNLEIQRQLQQQQQQYYGAVNNSSPELESYKQQQQQQQYSSIPANATIFKTHQFSAAMPTTKATPSLYGVPPNMSLQLQQQQQQQRLYGSDTGSELSFDGRNSSSSSQLTSPYMTVPHLLGDGGAGSGPPPQHAVGGYQTVSASPTTITTNTSPASNTLLRQNIATLLQHQQLGGVTPATMRPTPPNGHTLPNVYQKPPKPLNAYQQQPTTTTSQQQQHQLQQLTSAAGYNGGVTTMPYTQQQSSSPYQRVPLPLGYDNLYHEQPSMGLMTQQQQQQLLGLGNSVAQQQQQQQQPKPVQKKVSFEPGTKGGGPDGSPGTNVSPSPSANGCQPQQQQQQQHYQLQLQDAQQQQQQNVVGLPTRVVPIATTYGNGSAIVKPSAKAVQCNLCRKKHCILPAIYCSDCETYLARFQMPVRR